MNPETAILLMAQLLEKAEKMHPEALAFELEEIQDSLVLFCNANFEIEDVKKAYLALAKAKMVARSLLL